jgi:hypothetical protein
MTTPDAPAPDDGEPTDAAPPKPDRGPGVEIGMSDEGGGTFEPEEDPEAVD